MAVNLCARSAQTLPRITTLSHELSWSSFALRAASRSRLTFCAGVSFGGAPLDKGIVVAFTGDLECACGGVEVKRVASSGLRAMLAGEIDGAECEYIDLRHAMEVKWYSRSPRPLWEYQSRHLWAADERSKLPAARLKFTVHVFIRSSFFAEAWRAASNAWSCTTYFRRHLRNIILTARFQSTSDDCCAHNRQET